ncbi:MAG: ABC transporter ATP-binding protein [Betaproteobacteria bacterium]
MGKLLEVTGLQAGYGMFTVLHGLSFHVNEGEIVALVGSNGAGKTTTMRSLCGLLTPKGGQVRLGGELSTDFKSHQLVSRGLVCVPEGRQLFAELSVRDNLLVGAAVPHARALRSQTLERVYSLFPKLAERQTQLCGTLSGGEQQMVAIGRGLMAMPKMLLLDEPSLGLAPSIVKQLFLTVSAIRSLGVTVLIVEQNVRTVLQMADRAYVMENGRIELEGNARDLVTDPRVIEAYFGSGSKESL